MIQQKEQLGEVGGLVSVSVRGEERFENIMGFLKDHGLAFPEAIKLVDYSRLDEDGTEEDQWVGILIDEEGDWKTLEYFPTSPPALKVDGKHVI